MVKERVRRIDKVKYAASHNVNLLENDQDSSSDFSESDHIHKLNSDIVEKEVSKVLEKEGLYRFERKERAGHRKTVDYANNVLKHTAKFIAFVGGEELLHLPVITIIIVMSIIKTIMKKLHVSVVNKYCDHLSDMGFSASKQVHILFPFPIMCNIFYLETIINYIGFFSRGFVWASLLPKFNGLSLAPFKESCNICRRAYKIAYERRRRHVYDVEQLIKCGKWPSGGIMHLRKVVNTACKSMIRWAKSVQEDIEHFSSTMYTKFLNTLVAAFYVNGVQGRPQALSKLTWREYEEALKSGLDPASSHLKTAVQYGYQVK
jgi:hypothetical protein